MKPTFRQLSITLLCLVTVAGSNISAYCQQTATPTPASPVFSVAPYDVASIHIYPSMYSGGMHIQAANGFLLAEDAKLWFLIRMAYNIPQRLLVGGPS